MIHGWSAFGGSTMVGARSDWKDELGRWLKPFLDRLGHKARRQMCPLYVAGLIGPGDRKSVQPMAERLAPGGYDQLHHFVSAGVWDTAPLETELLIQADKLVGGSDAVLVIDDTAVPKKGKHSVGVAPQYASALGKTANCQTLVSLTLARGEVPVMVALRLFLPENWTGDTARLDRAGVPAEHRTARTKPEIALIEIDRMIAAGVRFGCVLADAGYGLSAPFRQGLSARKLVWAVGIPRHPQSIPRRGATNLASRCSWTSPVGGISRMFYRWPPKICLPMPSGRTSAGAPARRESSKPALLLSVCASPTDRHSGSGTRVSSISPGDEAWLIGEHRISGEKKYYLANLSAKTDLRTLAATIKARWICEQGHQQLKEELGLDHFEGRSWQGLHRHALLTMIAYAFLQHRRLTQVKRKKKNQRTSASAKLASRTPRHHRSPPSASASAMHKLPKMDRYGTAA
jgi:SRSO17 transposase